MDLRHYEHILALAEHGNFRKASEAVHISTPALTKSIQRSEDFFNVKLFDRTPSGAVLTPFGELVVRKAQNLLKEARDISSDVKSLMNMEAGRVCVGCGIYAAEALMGGALVRFLKKYPGIFVKVKITNLEDMIQMLSDKQIDFFVSVYPQHLKYSKLVRVVDLEREDLVWYVRPGHPLLEKKKITVSDIASYPFFFPTLTQPIHEWLLKIFKGTPLVKLNGTIDPHLQCNDIRIIKKTVAQSDGVGAFFRSGLLHELSSGLLCELRVKPRASLSPLGIVSLAGRTLPLAAQHLISILKEEHTQLLKNLPPKKSRHQGDQRRWIGK